ncbi:MAG: hypothetical protein AB1649_15865 [Chloroflexota bacterium]
MKQSFTHSSDAPNRQHKLVRLFDYVVFSALMIFLTAVVISSGRANIQTDSVDYYAIVQRLTSKDSTPIVRNLHFVEQRSPGYPVLSLIPYYITSLVIEPLVQTEEVTNPSNQAQTAPLQPVTESMLVPAEPLLFKDVFFKNFYIETQDSWFEWKIISSMLFTGYGLLFIGLIMIVKTLGLENKPVLGASLASLVVVTSSVFMHNIVNTPAYATLTAFGLSCLFGYFFVKGSLDKTLLSQFLSGLFLGLLVLTRLETVVFASSVFISLLVVREFRFLRDFVLGALVAATILLLYNFSQYGNPFHLGILRGDINLISFDLGYIYANLFNPQSGILFWSTLASLGIVGLFMDGKRYTKILGIGSLALIALVLIRVPIMYTCIGDGTKLIGGLPVTCPNNMAEMVNLIRFDGNRYITVLIPFSVLGLRTLVVSTPTLWHEIQVLTQKHKAG